MAIPDRRTRDNRVGIAERLGEVDEALVRSGGGAEGVDS